MPVQVIKATRSPVVQPTPSHKLNVAAYCRVSTDSSDQENSYLSQCDHFRSYISSNADWNLAGIYADEGISGTSMKHRDQFNKMLADCEAGRIDMVITKSISRWARNTVDSLNSIRKLRDLGIPIKFEKENINSLDAGGEMLVSILSSLSQAESESISKNVRIGIQYLFQKGKGMLNDAQFLGYTKDDTGKLIIEPEGAVIIRRIYREYMEGFSIAAIAAHLTAGHIPTPTGKETWYTSTVQSILENEKYAGDLLMQKYYTTDFLSHKVVKNNGTLPQYFVEDAHDPIVPKEVYYQVQGEMQRRSALKFEPTRIRYGSTQALTGRLVCGHCGRVLKRYVNPDSTLTDWRCRVRAYEKHSITKENAAICPCRNAKEAEVKAAITTAFNQLPEHKVELLKMQAALRDGELKRMDAELESLKSRYHRLAESLADEGSDVDFIQGELDRLEEEQSGLLLERAEAANTEVRLRLLLEIINSAEGGVDDGSACSDYDDFFVRTRSGGWEGKYDNDFVVKYLEKVIVLDDGYEVVFKGGVTVTVSV